MNGLISGMLGVKYQMLQKWFQHPIVMVSNVHTFRNKYFGVDLMKYFGVNNQVSWYKSLADLK